MEPETTASRPAVSFAPRTRTAETVRTPVRASLLFIGVGLVLTVVTVLWLGILGEPAEIRLDVTDIKIDETGEVELTGATYRGRTQTGDQYEITAEVASERSSGEIDMDSPTAMLIRTDGERIDLKSRSGVYFPENSVIDLDGDVVVTSAQFGMTLLAETLRANLTAGDMVSTQPVRVERADGFVTADGMEVTGQGDRIIFYGNARMTLNNESGGE